MSRNVLVAIAVACLASVAGALFAQHHWGMEPCPWCILQRILFLLIAALATLGALIPQRMVRIALSALIIPAAFGGVAAAWYQHFVAAKSSSCNMTFADKVIGALHLDTNWPDVFEVRANCADAAANLMGVPFEFWSLALYVLLSLAAAWVIRQQRASTSHSA